MAILLVKQSDSPVPDSPGKWRAGEIVAVFPDDKVFGGAEVPSAGNFYHVTVTNKTVAEIEQYQEQWQHEPTLSVVAAQPPNYRIRMESSKASVAGLGEILRPEIDQMLTELGDMIGGSATFHDRGRTGNLMWFEFNVLGVDADERDAARDFIERRVRDLPIRRRQFYINSAGLALLAGNDGTASGTAAQVAGFINNALTDD